MVFVVERGELFVGLGTEVLFELLAEPLVGSAGGVCVPLLAGLSDVNGFVLDGRQVVPTFGVVVADGQFVLGDFAVVVGVDFVEASVAGVFTSAGLVGDLGAGLGAWVA